MYEQVIYFGAPGSGKSYYVSEKYKKISKEKIFRVTIHPEYSYSDFIGQLLPETSTEDGNVKFVFKPGPFTMALIEAFNDSSQDVYLIIEEISRGNITAIFGDIFQLLDRDSFFKSRYPIRNIDISKLIIQLNTNEIHLPSNFNIVCTVNINDQSVFPIDTAFKRRFDWVYVPTHPAQDNSGNRLSKLNNVKMQVNTGDFASECLITTWQSFYSALNSFITDKENGMGKNEDKQLGQFFIDFGDSLVESSHSQEVNVANSAMKKVNHIIKNKLLVYLWQDVQGYSSMNNTKRLFNRDVKSFEDVFTKYGNTKVFSDDFIEKFLKPNLSKYPY